jgi:hypothetical protein
MFRAFADSQHRAAIVAATARGSNTLMVMEPKLEALDRARF